MKGLSRTGDQVAYTTAEAFRYTRANILRDATAFGENWIFPRRTARRRGGELKRRGEAHYRESQSEHVPRETCDSFDAGLAFVFGFVTVQFGVLA